MTPLASLVDVLKQNTHFVIATHINPDGDGIGSAIALSLALEAKGKHTVLLCYDPVPKNCAFLPSAVSFRQPSTLNLSADDYKNYKSLILVDCNNLKRTNLHKVQNLQFQFETILVIDHHETPSDFGTHKWIAPEVPATAMMIYYLIRHLDIAITPEIAANLYAGIIVDTGNFRHENTVAEVLRVSAELASTGINPSFIYRQLFECWSKERFQLFKTALNSIRIYEDVSVIVITQALFAKTGTTYEDTDNLVEFPRVTDEIKISILIREVSPSECKASLRSKDDFNVAKIAAYFGGGGHKNAAGCTIKADTEAACSMLLEAIKKARANEWIL